MARLKGSIGRIETKNRVVKVRVTAREYAKTIQLARYTNHTVSEILRKFVEDGIKEHQEDFKNINVVQEDYITKRVFKGNSNSNRKSKRWSRPIDKLYHKKLIEELEVNPLTDSAPAVIEDHDIGQVFSVYESIVKKKVKT